jgi:hypothetical protein
MVPIGLVVAQGSVLLDSYHYGTLTVTPWRFYAANMVHGYAAYFGVQPWHWSVTQVWRFLNVHHSLLASFTQELVGNVHIQGLPTVLGVYLPLVVFGVYYNAKSAFIK